MSEVSIEDQARQLGWVPQEDFRGPAEQWKDAETFVRDGEAILPILRSSNKKLSSQLQQTQQQVDRLTRMVEAGQDSLKAFEEFHTESIAKALEQQRKELREQIKDAQASGDEDLEERLQDSLDEVKDKQKALKQAPAKETVQAEVPQVDPTFLAWHADNKWFGTDRKLTAYANAMATELRKDPAYAGVMGAEFYELVTQQVRETFPESFPQQHGHSKVDVGQPSAGARRSGGKTYNDLPAEAKAACDRFGQRLVGEGRAFKDVEAWRKQYAKDFFGA